MAINVFISYAQGDEGHLFALNQHLAGLKREGLVNTWHSRMIEPGPSYWRAVDPNLEGARLIILLVSASFLDSRYCYDVEVARAFERLDAGAARVIPVVVKPCDWTNTRIAPLSKLPEGEMPVTRWPDEDRAWANVAYGIRATVERMLARRPSERPPGVSKPPSDLFNVPPAVIRRSSYNSAYEDAVASSRRSMRSLHGYVAEARAPSHPTIPPVPMSSPPKAQGLWRWALGACALTLFGLMVAIAVFASKDQPPEKEGVQKPAGSASGPIGHERACCGGVECAESKRNVSGSYCERLPGQCHQCPSGRRLVPGACRDVVSPVRHVRLRLDRIEHRGRALSGGEVCLRRSGEPESMKRCQTPGGTFNGMTVAVGELLEGGRGLHVEVRQNGVVAAERPVTVVQGTELGSSVLCVGAMLRVDGAAVYMYLDD